MEVKSNHCLVLLGRFASGGVDFDFQNFGDYLYFIAFMLLLAFLIYSGWSLWT